MTKTDFNRLVSQDIRAKVRAAQAAQLAAEEARIAELKANTGWSVLDWSLIEDYDKNGILVGAL